MDIGTGKDKPKTGPKIHGYDLVKPDQDFSVAHFVNFALPLIKAIHKAGELPIVVGGTGLYLKALTQPLDTINIKPNLKLRKKLNQLTVKQLQAQLKQLNPDRFNSMNHSDQLNPRRLIRALEISPSHLQGPTLKAEFDILWIGLSAKKPILDKRIVKRVEKRIKQGAEQEVKALIKAGYSWDLPSLSAMGYRQWQPYFAGQATLEDVKQTWITAEQQYLRHQLTWFKTQPHINWLDITDKNLFTKVASQVKTWYTNIV
jgi:tRNA dimethylallyltransferase